MIRFLFALLLAVQMAVAVDVSPLATVTIQEDGRKKPYLVFAQEELLGMSGRTELEIEGRKMDAMLLVTTMWLQPEGWDAQPLILVNHKPLKEKTGLAADQKRFSYRELASNAEFLKLLGEAQAERARPGSPRLSGLLKEVADAGMRIARYEGIVNGSAFRFVANPAAADAQWTTPSAEAVAPLRAALVADNSPAFAAAAEAFRKQMATHSPQFQPPAWKIQLEVLYQTLHPIRWAWMLYAAAGIVLIVGGSAFRNKGDRDPAYVLAWVLAGVGFLFQFSGFVARIVIAGRAPVTNMYESVIWVAFGTILFALVFEAIYRCRFFLLGAVPVAVVSLILADTQTIALDRSINPLVPVLRDNFWLTTHVLTITLSYAAFLLALGIGHIALGTVLRGTKPSAALYNYLYRILQVGVFLLAVGTILGAVWANYSWGRFWDWDPKETWALVTLLAYLFVLHGRIAGKWGGFGMAVGAVLCFLCVLMAWYGVNYILGVGLHSYGFGTGGFGWALAFVVAELAFVAAAVVRNRSLGAPQRPVADNPQLVS